MYEKHDETISARAFLEALQGDAGRVVLTNCTIEGLLTSFLPGWNATIMTEPFSKSP